MRTRRRRHNTRAFALTLRELAQYALDADTCEVLTAVFEAVDAALAAN